MIQLFDISVPRLNHMVIIVRIGFLFIPSKDRRWDNLLTRGKKLLEIDYSDVVAIQSNVGANGKPPDVFDGIRWIGFYNFRIS